MFITRLICEQISSKVVGRCESAYIRFDRAVFAGIVLSAVFSNFAPRLAWAKDVPDNIPPTGIPEVSIATNLPDNGDIFGIRSTLAGSGITFAVTYTNEVLGNPSGGFNRGTLYDGLLVVAGDIDFEKLAGWEGLAFHSTFYQTHGRSISGENVGGIAAVSNIEAAPSSRLFEAWFEQQLMGDKITLLFGQLAADEEFLGSEGGGAFIASAFGWPTLTSSNIPYGGPIYPLATPGARLKFQPNDQLALLAGNS